MYISKYYTCEEIDQRLLQGYYDDAVARGFTGSLEDFHRIIRLGHDGYFGGVAVPTTDPGTPEYVINYIATTDGTYTNFNGIIVEHEVVILTNKSGSWEKIDINITTDNIKEGSKTQKQINEEVADLFVAAAAKWADDIDNGFTKRRLKGFTTKPDDLNSASDIGIYYMHVNAGYNKLRGTGLLSVGINFSNVVYQTFLSTCIPIYDEDGTIISFNSKACILSRSYQNGAWTPWKEQIPELSTFNIRENGRTQEEINAEFREDIDSNLLAIELDEFGGLNIVTGEHSTLDFDETFINEEGLIQLTYNV